MLKPANAIFTIISFSIILSFTGYMRGIRTPYGMYVVIFLIIITGIYASIYIIKSFEKKIELKSLSLAVFGLIYAVAMKGYISLLVLCMLIHLIFFTPTPNEYPDIHRSIGRFLIKNLPIVNKIVLFTCIALVLFLEIYNDP
jgi:hypothetical protein